jgi:hypothetical protein
MEPYLLYLGVFNNRSENQIFHPYSLAENFDWLFEKLPI